MDISCSTRTLFLEIQPPKISREESDCGNYSDCSVEGDSVAESRDYIETEEESGTYEYSRNHS